MSSSRLTTPTQSEKAMPNSQRRHRPFEKDGRDVREPFDSNTEVGPSEAPGVFATKESGRVSGSYLDDGGITIQADRIAAGNIEWSSETPSVSMQVDGVSVEVTVPQGKEDVVSDILRLLNESRED